MSKRTNKFSTIEIHILESGFGWINDSDERFTNKLFNLLAGESGKIDVCLQLIGPEAFRKKFLQCLNSAIAEIVAHGRVISPLNKHCPDYPIAHLLSLESWELTKIIDKFLEAFSHVAEDAWSPIMEKTWRKALQSLIANYQQPAHHSRFLRNSPLCLFPL